MCIIKEDKDFADKYIYVEHLTALSLKEKEKIIMLFQKNIIEEDELDSKLMEINNRIEASKNLVKELKDLQPDINTTKIKVINYIESYIDKIPMTSKNKVLCTLIKEIEIKKNQIKLSVFIPKRITQEF